MSEYTEAANFATPLIRDDGVPPSVQSSSWNDDAYKPVTDCEGGDEMMANDDSDALSTTSTEENGHEPFDTFQNRVAALCQNIWPQLMAEAFMIEHLPGGSFNRIISITVDTSLEKPSRFHNFLLPIWQKLTSFVKLFGINITVEQSTTHLEKYILRIPWHDNAAWVEHEVAIVQYVRSHTAVPAPDIYAYDLTYDNKINARYALQTLIPGETAMNFYSQLNTEQRIHFARQLGQAVNEIGKKALSSPGFLNPDSVFDGPAPISTVRFYIPSRNSLADIMNNVRRDKESVSSTQTPLEMIKSLLARQLQEDAKWDRLLMNPWERFETIMEAIDELGFFDDSLHYLTHLDLEPRNILIDVQNERIAELSAIIDWDSAVFGPAFLNCKPPQWLWDWQLTVAQGTEPDEKHANNIPADPSSQSIKQAFESAAGELYTHYAYTPEYRIARDICRFAIEGIESNEGYEQADQLFKDWNELHPESAVRLKLFEDFENEVDVSNDEAADVETGSEDEDDNEESEVTHGDGYGEVECS